MHRLRIIATFFRVGILNELAYRANFYVQVLQSFMSLGTALAGLGIVFSHTDSLGDWRARDILALLGIYLITGGLISLIIRPSMSQLMDDVRRGTLDYTLTKPDDAQFLVSINQIRIWKLTDFALGLAVLLYALFGRGLEIGFLDAAAFGLVLLCGAAIVYSFFLILSTFCFWFIRVDNILVVFDAMYQAGRWPIGLYPFWLKFILTFLVPIALAITVPAEALIGRLDQNALMLDIGVALGALIVSRLFWKHGLRNYSGASA